MLRFLPLIATAAALHTTDVPETLGAKVDRAKDRSGIEVLLPQTIRTEFAKLYGDVRARDGRYTLYLGAAKGCRGAGACGVASFHAARGGKPAGPVPVDLARGRTGKYTPISCGANCSSPTVEWKERGNTYRVEAKGLPEKSERRGIVKVANSAIRNGPR